MILNDDIGKKSQMLIYTTEDGFAKIETAFDGDTAVLLVLFQRCI